MYLTGDFIPKEISFKLPDFSNEYVLSNLEGPVCSANIEKGIKVGVHLRSSPFELKGKWAFALANNHIMDYGYDGLKQTREFLESTGISCCGAGATQEESRKPIILEESGYKIAVFSCCERQFGVSFIDKPGVAALGGWLYLAIKEIKRSGGADFVIISCHAASEFSPWVSPSLREFYHSLVDAGADIIHGHHSHVPQGYEVYKDCPIFYGLGNFLVSPMGWGANKNYFWSIVAKVRFTNGRVQWSVSPYGIIEKNGSAEVLNLNGQALQEIENYIRCANIQFTDDRICKGCWQEAAIRLFPRLYSTNLRLICCGDLRFSFRQRLKLGYFAICDIFAAIKGRVYNSRRSKLYAMVGYNMLSCESHIDMMRTYLGLITNTEIDCRDEKITQAAEELEWFE